MTDYYDWHKTLSYNADVTMVIGARGIGKTYGLRKQSNAKLDKMEIDAEHEVNQYDRELKNG